MSGSVSSSRVERHPAPLAAGEHADGRVAGRAAQRLHRLFQAVVQVPGVVLVQLFLQLALLLDQRVEVRVRLAERVGDLVELPQHVDDRLHRLLDHLADGLVRVQLRLLLSSPRV